MAFGESITPAITSPREQRLVILIMFVVGAAAVGGSVLLTASTLHFVVSAERTTGELTGYDQRRDMDGTLFFPRFVFTDAHGQTHEVTASSGSRSRPHTVGAAVTVLYDPGNPSRASIHNRFSTWIGPMFLGAFGAGFLVMARMALVAYRPYWEKLADQRDGESSKPEQPPVTPQMSPEAAKWVLRLFFVIGLGLMAGSLVWTTMQLQFLATAEQTPGTIVRYQYRSSSGNGGGSHFPVFTFTDSRGEVHEVTASSSSSRRPYRIGESVNVLYDPANPFTATLNTFGSIWGGPLLIGGMGIGCTVLTALLFISMRREEANRVAGISQHRA